MPQVFFISRIVIYPFFIVRATLCSMLVYMHPYMTISEVLASGVGFPPAWWLYNGLLLTLMGLHTFWFTYGSEHARYLSSHAFFSCSVISFLPRCYFFLSFAPDLFFIFY